MLVVDWSKETAFLLGRQFAVYELIQVASRGRGFHGSIMTDLYQAAASEPRRIFPLLDRRCEIDLARIWPLPETAQAVAEDRGLKDQEIHSDRRL